MSHACPVPPPRPLAQVLDLDDAWTRLAARRVHRARAIDSLREGAGERDEEEGFGGLGATPAEEFRSVLDKARAEALIFAVQNASDERAAEDVAAYLDLVAGGRAVAMSQNRRGGAGGARARARA